MRHIIDTTLREGEQTPGLLFTLDEKKHIVDGLVRLGISEIEAGISSRFSTCLPDLMAWSRETHPELKISLWSRCRREDIDYAAGLGPDIIALSIPVSELQIEKRLNRSRQWVRERMEEAIREALQCGLSPAVGFEDATRAEISFLQEMALAAKEAGAVRVRLADTVGIASPASITALVQNVRQAVGDTFPVGVHTHNDFGMATGNAIAAFEAGADCADAVLFGLGERSGCASIEQLTGWLALVAGASYNAGELQPLVAFVANCAGRMIPVNQPLVGENIFACESGLHLHGIYKNPAVYEPYNPEKVGAERKLQIGAKTGRAALARRLDELGLHVGTNMLETLLISVRESASRLRRPLRDDELRSLVRLSVPSVLQPQ